MTLLTRHQLLSHIRDYLDGSVDFSAVRNWVFQFYEAEEPYKLDDVLEEVFPILLPYLQCEEAETDSIRELRFRRVYELLGSATSAFAECTVFALEFDEIRELTKKVLAGVITKDTYRRKMARLLPAPYDTAKLLSWADAQRHDTEPTFLRRTGTRTDNGKLG